METRHISSTRFETGDPGQSLADCQHVLQSLGIVFESRGAQCIEAEISGVSLEVAAQNATLEISLKGEARDRIAALRSGVQARLEGMDPALADITWSGVGKPGDLAPYFSFARVESVSVLNDDFIRMVLQGGDLGRFARGGLHIRILRQRDPARDPVWPRLAQNGSVDWPKTEDQLIHRAYTARHVDRDGHRIAVDILRHKGGPTAEWALSRPVGETIGLTGPGGGDLPDANWVLLAGDETAQPAILRMLETLPAGTNGKALVMAGAPGRETPVDNRTRIRLRWLYRNRGDDLTATLRDIALPARDDRFLWFAGSRSQAREVRAYFRDTLGQDRSRFISAAYWE